MRDQGQDKHATPVHISELMDYIDPEVLAMKYIRDNLGELVQDMPAWKEVDGNVALLEKSMESDGAAGETLKLRGHEYKTYVAYGRGLARKLSSSLGRQWRT